MVLVIQIVGKNAFPKSFEGKHDDQSLWLAAYWKHVHRSAAILAHIVSESEDERLDIRCQESGRGPVLAKQRMTQTVQDQAERMSR